MGSFSKKEAIKFGWGVMKSHSWFFVAILLISGFIPMLPNLANTLAGEEKPLVLSLVLFVLSIAGFIMKLILDLGFIQIALNLHDHKPVVITDLFRSYPALLRYFLASILYFLIIIGGFILLIIPGIILSIRFQYYSYLIVDKDLGPIEALRQSWRMTKGHAWNLFLLGVLLGLINLGGALLLMIGLLATIPTTMMAQAFVFRKLQAAFASTPATTVPASA